ncbi:FUSC family protein [Arthrobacter crystallopoietes]|uniref:FUSC family protein n=1 Tax=Crystallibacter crystallopoietes TaxID=37928 RepID=UPI003D1EF8D4
MKEHVREFFRVGPARQDHIVGLRCAASVGLPLLVLLAMDRFDLMVFAAFGAFTGIYGRGEAHGVRLRHQGEFGVLILLVMFAGALTAAADAGPWGIVIGTTVVAGVLSLAVNYFALRPAGVIFFTFGYAAIGSIQPMAPLGQAMLTGLISVVLAMLIGVSSRLRPAWRTSMAPPAKRVLTPDHWREFRVEAGANAVAALAAGTIATMVGLGHNYWAMVAAVAPIAGPSLAQRIKKGVHRILGTFAGVVAAGLLLAPHPAPWVLVLMVIVLQFAAEMFVLRHYALALIFITPLALIMTELSAPTNPEELMVDRALQTAIGALVGISLVYLMHQRTLREKNRRRFLKSRGENPAQD